MGEPAIQTENLGKLYRLGVGAARYDTLREALARTVRPGRDKRRDLWALRGVDLEVERGEALGIVGPNGAGKTTLLRILAGITYPTEGAARTRGSVGALLDVGTGFHPELTGRENVFLSGAVLGMRRREIRARFDEIVEFSGVERFLDTPVKRYSAGMRLRLAFAVAAHLEPPIVVVDEVLAVGDSAFREKCMGKMAEMGRRDRTVLFVSHDLGAITRLCTRAVWLDGGRIQSDGTPREIVSSYLERATPGRVLDVEFDAEPSAAAAVQRVTVRDAATGQVLTTPERGQPFTIEVAFEVREAIPELNIALILVDALGAVILDDAMRDRPIGIGRELSGESGTYVVTATIPPLLRAGTYTVRTWIGNDYGCSVDRDLLSIRVAPRADDPQEFMQRTRAVQPEIEWKVRRERLA
jgi:ABC-2 type transport system ATP-binding protein/lipopolysaccharide transport system ATP-binding protein